MTEGEARSRRGDVDSGSGAKNLMRDHVAYKLKGIGKKKPVIEEKTGQEFFRETGTWRDRDFQVNHQGNRIRETITDQQTGEIIRKYDEPLTQHSGRGSAKEPQLAKRKKRSS